MPQKVTPAKILEAVRKAPGTRVKVAVSDIDGILRGKYIHKDKFESAVEGGFGFCDVVFGWDSQDVCYDNTTITGWHKGFPDALARIDLGTHRNVPWDDGVPFFLGDFVATSNGKEVPLSICPRQILKRVLARAQMLGFTPMCGMEFEWFNFMETPQSWAAKKGVGPEPITPGGEPSALTNSPRKKGTWLSHGTWRAVSRSSRASASGKPCCQPVTCALS